MGQTMSPRSDLVDASVPNEWIGASIGHHIWSRPAAKPGAHADWVELLDVWEEETGDPSYPFRFRAWIWWKGKAWVTVLAKMVHTRGIPAEQCTFLEWDRDGETVRYHPLTTHRCLRSAHRGGNHRNRAGHLTHYPPSCRLSVEISSHCPSEESPNWATHITSAPTYVRSWTHRASTTPPWCCSTPCLHFSFH